MCKFAKFVGIGHVHQSNSRIIQAIYISYLYKYPSCSVLHWWEGEDEEAPLNGKTWVGFWSLSLLRQSASSHLEPSPCSEKYLCWHWYRCASVALGIACPWLSGIEDLHSIFMNPHKAIVLQFLIDCLYVMRTTNIDLSEWLRKVSCDCFSLTQAAKVAGWITFHCMQWKAHYLKFFLVFVSFFFFF